MRFREQVLNWDLGSAIFVFAGKPGNWNPKTNPKVPKKVQNLLRSFGISALLPKYNHLKHGNTVVWCNPSTQITEADAFITSTKRLPLLAYISDCPAVALVGNGVIALVHSGRKGTEQNIVQKVVREMGRARKIEAIISPYIGACRTKCYELDRDSARPLLEMYPEALVGQKKGKLFLDLGIAIEKQLQEAGVRSIQRPRMCTWCRRDLWSYRRRTPEEMSYRPNNGAVLVLK